MSNKIILISGGSHSGKTKYAIELAKKLKKETVYIATLDCPDDETRKRMQAHEKTMPATWQKVEEDKNVDMVLVNIAGLSQVALIDSLSILAGNLLEELKDSKKVYLRVEALLKVIADSELDVILVTKEVGGALMPENLAERKLVSLIGAVNQLVASAADEIYLMVMGLPVKIK